MDSPDSPVEAENRPSLAHAICGWKQPRVSLDWARRYWRDVHSPAIARRDGIYDYRHMQFDSVRTDLLAPVAGIEYGCPLDQQLMWLSDIRFLDDEALARFSVSPSADVRAHMLSDIGLIVDKSTTYRAFGSNARTLIDDTGIVMPAGPAAHPTFNLFLRARADSASFRAAAHVLARGLAKTPSVLRLRLTLFEAPGTATEFTKDAHPPEMRYQAWLELALRDEEATLGLITPDGLGSDISHIHAYPTPLLYSFVHNGRPTLIGLRGYPAYEAIKAIGASGQTEVSVLRWMYGAVVRDGPN